VSACAFQLACCIVVEYLFVFAGPPAKRQKLAMSFKHVGALDVRVNYLITPAAFDELVNWVGKGMVVMVNPEILHHAVA
jgi:hypothetical protein